MTRKVALGSIIEIRKGKKPHSVSDIARSGFVRHLQVADLRREREPEYVPAAGAVIASPNDILICWDGSKAGTSATGLAGAAGSTIAVIRIRDSAFTTSYVAWFIQASYDQINRTAVGAAVPHVDRKVLENLQLPVLDRQEQLRVADYLNKSDSIRQKRREAIGLTEDLLRSTFLEMVGPAANDSGSWPVRTVESLAARGLNAMRTGPFGSDLLHSEFVDEGVAVLGIDNAVQNRFAWSERRFITLDKYERLRRYTVHAGDVLVTIMGTTGRSAVVPDDIPTAITTKHLATITLDRQQAEPEFVSQAIVRHPDVLRQIAASNRGAIMSGLNLGLIKSLRLPLPPLELQRQFSHAVARLRAMASRMETNRLDDTLFKSLVARAFGVR